MDAIAPGLVPAAVRPGSGARSWRSLRWIGFWFVGTILCQFALGALLAVGWTRERVRRSVLVRWGGADRSSAGSFEAADPTAEASTNPILVPSTDVGGRPASPLRLARRVLHLMGQGASSWSATWLLLAPAQILWAFSWYAGWHVSFAKVYEQSDIGLLTAGAGTFLFLLTAPLVVLAQARHAVTDSWRTAVELPVLWRLLAERPWSSTVLALGYGLATVPLTVLIVAPLFFGQNLEGSVAELRQIAARYWFWVTALGWPLYFGLHLAAGRLYGCALRSAALAGRLPRSLLHPTERRLLDRRSPCRAPSALLRRVALLPSVGLVCVLWFGVVVQNYATAFLNDRGPRQWLNLPLLELPWWRAIPDGLTVSAASESDRSPEVRRREIEGPGSREP